MDGAESHRCLEFGDAPESQLLLTSWPPPAWKREERDSSCAGSLLAEAEMEAAGRPRANRAEDWSARPPEEGCWGHESNLEAAAVAAAAVAILVAVAYVETSIESAGSLARAFLFEGPGGDLAEVDLVADHCPDQEVPPPEHLRRIRMRASNGSKR